jgi:hypothetical protein
MKEMRAERCRHDDYIFDYDSNEHVCEQCRLKWRDTGQPMESSNYIFDRLLGSAY